MEEECPFFLHSTPPPSAPSSPRPSPPPPASPPWSRARREEEGGGGGGNRSLGSRPSGSSSCNRAHVGLGWPAGARVRGRRRAGWRATACGRPGLAARAPRGGARRPLRVARGAPAQPPATSGGPGPQAQRAPRRRRHLRWRPLGPPGWLGWHGRAGLHVQGPLLRLPADMPSHLVLARLAIASWARPGRRLARRLPHLPARRLLLPGAAREPRRRAWGLCWQDRRSRTGDPARLAAGLGAAPGPRGGGCRRPGRQRRHRGLQRCRGSSGSARRWTAGSSSRRSPLNRASQGAASLSARPALPVEGHGTLLVQARHWRAPVAPCRGRA